MSFSWVFFLLQKQNLTAANCFREFLHEKNENIEFEDFSKNQLADALERFYTCARTRKGECYRGKSLNSLRYGINRYLQSAPIEKDFCIINDPAFKKANEALRNALNKLKSTGLCKVQHSSPINETDLKKLYTSKHLNPDTPDGLSNKVQFDVRFYLIPKRHAKMDMATMTKETFTVKVDMATGKKVVMKTSNDLNDKETDMEPMTMPETGGARCPVANFEKYVSLLHPKCDKLWQYPSDKVLNFDSNCWYQNKPIGINSLKKLMGRLSLLANLSRKYTNISIRATAITSLERAISSPRNVFQLHASTSKTEAAETLNSSKTAHVSIPANILSNPTVSIPVQLVYHMPTAK